jgi:hypothetical protein
MITIHNRVNVFENIVRPKGSKRVSLLRRLTEYWVASKRIKHKNLDVIRMLT